MRRRWASVLVAALAMTTTPGFAPAREVVGFYVPWDPQSQASLAQHLDDITVFAPQWINLAGAPGAFNLVGDEAAQGVLGGAKRRLKIMPLITNAHDGRWDAAAADAVLMDPSLQGPFVAALAHAADDHGFAGYILDFENLSPQGAAAYPALVASLKAALAPRRKRVWVTTPLLAEPAYLQTLNAAADATVVMAYDQCWATSTPGPVAGVDWLAASQGSRRAGLPPARTIVALGSYAYDWPDGGPAKALSIAAAEALAQAHGAPIVRASPSMNATFDYQDDSGRGHHVWLADAGAVAAAKKAFPANIAGWGLWRLGLEDPPVWGRSAPTSPARPVVKVQPPPCEPSP